MEQKIIHMLEMQDAMNSKVNKDWRNAGFEWYRDIWMEASEMLEHYGWKWWKRQRRISVLRWVKRILCKNNGMILWR